MDSNFDLTYIVSIKIQTTRELQILIGGSENHPLAEQSEEELDRMVAINLKEVWLSMKFQIPAILKNGRGAIVNNSSMGGLIAFSGIAPYHAVKHGALGLTKSAALDYAKSRLRINVVCPVLLMTDLLARMMGGQEAM